MAFLQQAYPIAFKSSVTNLSQTSSLEMPGSFLYVYLMLPTMSVGYSAAATPIYLQVSPDNVTFYRFSNPESNTSVVGANDFTIQSSVSQKAVLIPSFGFRYVKLEISGTVTAPASQTSGFYFVTVSNQ